MINPSPRFFVMLIVKCIGDNVVTWNMSLWAIHKSCNTVRGGGGGLNVMLGHKAKGIEAMHRGRGSKCPQKCVT